jgi:hypothetical protein
MDVNSEAVRGPTGGEMLMSRQLGWCTKGLVFSESTFNQDMITFSVKVKE